MNVTEFRKDISKHLDAALRGEKVTIERGGVTYAVNAYIDELGNVPANTPMTHVTQARNENESYSVVMPPITLNASNTEADNPFAKHLEFCQHGAVKGMCKKGCK